MEDKDFLKNLKWKELVQVEEYLGVSMDEWDNSKQKAKLAFAMQYMMAKRNNAGLTIEDAENMSIADLTELAGVEFTSPKEVNPV